MGAAAILVAAALVALGAIVGGNFSDTDARILISLVALRYTGGAGLAGLALADRGTARRLGLLVAGVSPVCLAIVLWAIWAFVDEGDNEPQWKLAWSAVLVLLSGLIATTGILLARRDALVVLAGVAGLLESTAAGISIAGIWSGSSSDALLKLLAVLWILAALTYFLVPVLGRFTVVGEDVARVRVLAELGTIQLVASRSRVEGVPADFPTPGERLFLRRYA